MGPPTTEPPERSPLGGFLLPREGERAMNPLVYWTIFWVALPCYRIKHFMR